MREVQRMADWVSVLILLLRFPFCMLDGAAPVSDDIRA